MAGENLSKGDRGEGSVVCGTTGVCGTTVVRG